MRFQLRCLIRKRKVRVKTQSNRYNSKKKANVHEPRLERGPPVWETGILPLNYSCQFLLRTSCVINLAEKYQEMLSSHIYTITTCGKSPLNSALAKLR